MPLAPIIYSSVDINSSPNSHTTREYMYSVYLNYSALLNGEVGVWRSGAGAGLIQ